MITLTQYQQAAQSLEDKIMSPATMIRNLCVALTDLTNSNSNIGTMPNSGDLHCTFYDYGGSDMQDSRNAIDMEYVQVRSRGSYESSYNILLQIKLALHAIPELTLTNGDTLIGIWLTSSIAHLGKDDKNRSLHTLNLKVAISPTNKGNRI